MTDQILFIETQKFRKWWLWIFILGIDFAFAFSIFKKMEATEISFQNLIQSPDVIIPLITLILVTSLFLFARLDTKITKKGIFVRFYPIRINYKFLPWDSIQEINLVKYNALLEYGGWGIRYGDGKALNTSGNRGLKIKFKNQKKLLIGTNKPDELEKTLSKNSKI